MARRRGKINLLLSRIIGGGAKRRRRRRQKQKTCRKNVEKWRVELLPPELEHTLDHGLLRKLYLFLTFRFAYAPSRQDAWTGEARGPPTPSDQQQRTPQADPTP